MAQDGRLNRRLLGVCSARLRELGLGEVADPRKRAGRWRLRTLLAATLLGLAAGCKNLRQVERLTQRLSRPVRRCLGIGSRAPDTTMRDLLVQMDPEELRRVLHRQAKLAQRRKALRADRFPFGVVAIDGRSTATPMTDGNTYAQTHHDNHGRERCGLVRTMTTTLVSSSAQPCLDACPIPPTTNDMAAIIPMSTININRVFLACSNSSNGTMTATSWSRSCEARVALTTSAVGITCSTPETRNVIWLSSTISPSKEPLRRVTT